MKVGDTVKLRRPVKSALPEKHYGHSILISEMYELAVDINVNVESMTKFIRKCH